MGTKASTMYAEESTGCCGVIELYELAKTVTKKELNDILMERFNPEKTKYWDSFYDQYMESGSADKGMAIAFFVRCVGDKKITGYKNRTMMLRNGFTKLPAFWNPNSGNWIYPVYITRNEWLKRNKPKKK